MLFFDRMFIQYLTINRVMPNHKRNGNKSVNSFILQIILNLICSLKEEILYGATYKLTPLNMKIWSCLKGVRGKRLIPKEVHVLSGGCARPN